eukprot:Amastigsp_a1162_163.p3 type:complete len:118 gc:universal Amastigsp_a1162_163:756-1109(+)
MCCSSTSRRSGSLCSRAIGAKKARATTLDSLFGKRWASVTRRCSRMLCRCRGFSSDCCKAPALPTRSQTKTTEAPRRGSLTFALTLSSREAELCASPSATLSPGSFARLQSLETPLA